MADLFTYIVYISTLFLCVFFLKKGSGKQASKRNKEGNLVFVLLGFLVLVLVAGLRYNTGQDYEGYAYLYEEVVNMDDTLDLDMEIGFIVLVEFLNSINLGVWSFFTVSAFLTYSLFLYSFKNYRSLLYLGIFFFITYGFYFYSFNGLRQSVAMSALAVGVLFAQERKIIHFFVLILLGGLMHKSLFLFLPLYFVINRVKLSSYFWYAAFGVSLILHFIPFENFLKLEFISNILSGTLVDYSNFATNITDNANEAGGLSLGYMVRVCIGLFILSFYSKLVKIDPACLPYFTLSLTGIVLYNSFSHILFISRINQYFLLFTTFSLAFIIHYLFKSKQKLVANSVLMIFLLFFCYGIYLGDNGCSPYQFIKF